MLYYKNSRFYFGGMSFALPENILIDTDYERDTPNGFAFLSHDRKIRITVRTEEAAQSLKDYIKSDDFAENGFTVSAITEGGYAGICGERAVYSDAAHEYCETRLKLPHPEDGMTAFIIFIEVCKKEIAIDEAVKHPIIAELLMSLEKDF